MNAHKGASEGAAAFEERINGVHDTFKRDFVMGDGLQIGRFEIGGKTHPYRLAQRSRSGHGIDAEQIHAAQDEGEDGSLESGAAGTADCSEVASPVDERQEAGQKLAANGVHRAGKTRAFKWFCAELRRT